MIANQLGEQTWQWQAGKRNRCWKRLEAVQVSEESSGFIVGGKLTAVATHISLRNYSNNDLCVTMLYYYILKIHIMVKIAYLFQFEIVNIDYVYIGRTQRQNARFSLEREDGII